MIHRFSGRDGALPFAGLTFDSVGNLYGTTEAGGNLSFCNSAHQPGCGVVFELMPETDGGWTVKVLHSFKPTEGSVPTGRVVFDRSGNLYGTTDNGGDPNACVPYGCGVVFKLAPSSAGWWQETILHYFENKPAVGPVAGPILDSAGNLYGTTMGNGNTTFGSVYEITP